MPEATEITHICIDNSSPVRETAKFTAQLEAIELYCETKFKCNPNHLVGLSVMSSNQNETLLSPTNDIQQIRRSLKGICCSGDADFESVFMKISGDLLRRPPNMKNSLLLFVASPILIVSTIVREYGNALKKNGIAVNVVNLFVLEEGDLARLRWLRGHFLINGEYHYGRKELGVLFDAANNDGNSHIVDVKDPSSVCEMLSNSILKKDPLYLEKNHQKNAEENVNVKQQLELSHKESVNVKAPRIQSFKKLEQCHNEKNKSAANDEIVQPPGIKQYPTKKAPPLPRKKFQQKPKEKVNVETRSGTLAMRRIKPTFPLVTDIGENEHVKLEAA